MQRLGQHFLKNKGVLNKILGALQLEAGTPVIEIGPGHGELTALISAASENSAGGIVAIEKDEKLAAALEGSGIKNLEIKKGDALTLLAPIASRFKKFKIAGNIPYYITGKLLRIISELPEKPERAVLLVQREVAERISSTPPKMNRLAASVQFWSDPKIVSVVPKEDFSPPPKIDSAIILLKTKEVGADIESVRYYAAVRALFAQPRKTILNNIAAKGGKKEEISAILLELNLLPEARPQDLAVSDIISISRRLF